MRNISNVEEFELHRPSNYEDMTKNADNLLAELLVRYYFEEQKKCLTEVNYYGNIINNQEGDIKNG